jgi:hypothetical protein
MRPYIVRKLKLSVDSAFIGTSCGISEDYSRARGGRTGSGRSFVGSRSCRYSCMLGMVWQYLGLFELAETFNYSLTYFEYATVVQQCGLGEYDRTVVMTRSRCRRLRDSCKPIPAWFIDFHSSIRALTTFLAVLNYISGAVLMCACHSVSRQAEKAVASGPGQQENNVSKGCSKR